MRHVNPCIRRSHSLPPAARRCWQASLAATAANLCEQSAHAYEQVLGDDGATREDARVNMGNALALWAEHCETRGDNPLAMGLLERAAACYDSALAKTPEDVDICTNLADVTMQVCSACVSSLGASRPCRRPACACVRLSPSHAVAALLGQRAELAHTMGRVQSSEQLYQQGIEVRAAM
jgi:tetratricopeptide (TPR) repeat protein